MSLNRQVFIQDVSLDSYNTMSLPCVASHVAEIHDEWSLSAIFNDYRGEFFVLGGGSNVILPPNLSKLVIWMQNKNMQILREDESHLFVEVGAGECWHDFVSWTISKDLSGLENLALIPGTVGAAPIQNIGAYGVEVAGCVDGVRVFDTKKLIFFWLPKEECHFSYRTSVFKKNAHWIVSDVRFKLSKKFHPQLTYKDLQGYFLKSPPESVKKVFNAVIRIRQRKLPDFTVTPNVGSFFKNVFLNAGDFAKIKHQLPEKSYVSYQDRYKIFAAVLIEACQLRGKSLGNVGISDQHALVLVNLGGASSNDVKVLAKFVQNRVFEHFGVLLETEPIFV